jgi:hypothetical protein
MPDITDPAVLAHRLLDLNRPGIVIEVDRRTAEALGAFEEDALGEEDALASADSEDRAGTH